MTVIMWHLICVRSILAELTAQLRRSLIVQLWSYIVLEQLAFVHDFHFSRDVLFLVMMRRVELKLVAIRLVGSSCSAKHLTVNHLLVHSNLLKLFKNYYTRQQSRSAWAECLFACLLFVCSITQKPMIQKCSNLVEGMTLGYPRNAVVLGLKNQRSRSQGQ